MSTRTKVHENEITNIGFGVPSQGADREAAAVDGTRQKAIWGTNSKVSAVEITVLSEVAGTAELNAAVGICFDAPNDAVADNWLTAGSHLTDDAEHVVVAVGETRRFQFIGSLGRLDLKRLYGTEALRVKVKAEDSL